MSACDTRATIYLIRLPAIFQTHGLSVEMNDDDIETIGDFDDSPPPSSNSGAVGDSVRRPFQPVRGRLVDQTFSQYYGEFF